MGEFPSSSEFALIPGHWKQHFVIDDPFSPSGARHMGVDVARYGHDKTVIVVRDSRCVLAKYEYSGLPIPEVVNKVVQHQKEWTVPADNIRVDDTGVGGGVTDLLLDRGWDVIAVVAQASAEDSVTFQNLRAEMYWNLREKLDPSAEQRFFIPKKYNTMIKELMMPEYKFTNIGKIQLEKKEDIKKRTGGDSPDSADALALSFASSEGGFEIGFAA
jgi:hypothetical protein